MGNDVKYLEAATDAELTQVSDDLNAAYLDGMRQKLRRAPGETIDSNIDAAGNITGPADRIITTALVEPIVPADPKVEGGLIPVDATVLEYLPPEKVAEAKEALELSAKWQAELATAGIAEAIDVAAETIKP